jgi:hypothetical protein
MSDNQMPLKLICRASGGFKLTAKGKIDHECRCERTVHDPRKGHSCGECETIWSGDLRGRVVA